MTAADGSRSGGSYGSGKVLAGIRILLAEDIWIIAEAQKQLLVAAGAEVIGPAATVAEAQSLAARGDYDCAVFDINLRGQMANAVIEALSAKGVQVVILTGSNVDPQLRAQAAACLEKPVTDEQLIRTIARAVGR